MISTDVTSVGLRIALCSWHASSSSEGWRNMQVANCQALPNMVPPHMHIHMPPVEAVEAVEHHWACFQQFPAC